MRDIFQALITVFPVSLDAQQFQDPAQHPRCCGTADARPTRRATGVAWPGCATASRLSPPLACQRGTDGTTTVRTEQYQAAQFALHQLTERCFACHSKLPTPRRFALGQRFLAEAPLANLSLKERARLAVATRQFDTALEYYETLFQSPAITAGDIGLMGAFEDYLKIVVRVYNDVMRALLTLETFRQRPDVPSYLTEHLGSWVRRPQGDQRRCGTKRHSAICPYAHSRGAAAQSLPGTRLGLVHFVVASGLLHRYVDISTVTGNSSGRADYLLGVTESHISRTLWMPETEFFLETAIRLAPTVCACPQGLRLSRRVRPGEATRAPGVSICQQMSRRASPSCAGS